MVFSCRAYDCRLGQGSPKDPSASWHTLTNYSAYRMRRQRLPVLQKVAPLAE